MTWNEERNRDMEVADCHLCHPEDHVDCQCKAMCNRHQEETAERVRQLNQAFGGTDYPPQFTAEAEGDDFLFGRRPRRGPNVNYDLTVLTEGQLIELMEAIKLEQDLRLPLDPEPWTWTKHAGSRQPVPRRATGPQNDGNPQPHGSLSELLPREGYRQDRRAYAHTVRADFDVCGAEEHDGVEHQLMRTWSAGRRGPDEPDLRGRHDDPEAVRATRAWIAESRTIEASGRRVY